MCAVADSIDIGAVVIVLWRNLYSGDGMRGVIYFSMADGECRAVECWWLDDIDDEFYRRTNYSSTSKIATAPATPNYR